MPPGNGKPGLAVTAALLLGCSCLRQPPALPDLPALATEAFLPAIRDHVGNAYQQARADPLSPSANGKLGMVLQAYEQYDSSLICYRRARLLEPQSFRWAYYLGVVEAALGKNAEAAQTLRQAVRLDPDYASARIKLAESLLASGQVSRSREFYQTVLRQDPRLAMAHYGLGRLFTTGGDTAAAIEHFRQACELAPNFGSAHYALALAYRKSGQTALADQHLALYQKNKLGGPAEEDPLLAEVKQLHAGAAPLIREGVRMEQAGLLEQSAEKHEQALAIDPGYVQAHVNLVPLYGRLGRPQKAEEHYRAAAALNPNLAENHYNYGVLRHGQNRLAEAGAAFRAALQINPFYAEAHNNLAYVLEQQSRPEEALRHYRAAIENKPDYRLARFHIGRLLLQRGKAAEAISHLLLTLSPEDESTAAYRYALAGAYARAGNRTSAIEHARAARDRASAQGQTALLASIERDLRILENAGGAR